MQRIENGSLVSSAVKKAPVLVCKHKNTEVLNASNDKKLCVSEKDKYKSMKERSKMTKLVDMLDAFAFSQKLADLNIKIDMLSKEVARLNKKLPSKISAKVAGEILELYEFGFFDGDDKQQIQEEESKCDTTLQSSTDLSPSKNA